MADALTAERLRALFDYCPDVGTFRKRRGRGAGRVAGKLNEKGHRRIRADGKLYYAGRLAFFYIYGRWPNGVIDHKNGDPDDNRIANLREAQLWQNSSNSRHRKTSQHGLRGVRKQAKGDGWQAQISHRNKRYALGTFRTKEEAHAAYIGASKVLHGEFGIAEPDLLPSKPLVEAVIKIPRSDLTIEEVRRVLSYDPDTGLFRWLVDRGRHAKVGAVAGSKHGYHSHIVITVDGIQIGAHRLAWAFIHGEFPGAKWVDHINGVRNDNRISNLRLASPKENARNSGGWGRRASPLKGAYRNCSARNPWKSWITVDGQRIHLGSFQTPEEAHEAYMRSAREHFGEFARGG